MPDPTPDDIANAQRTLAASTGLWDWVPAGTPIPVLKRDTAPERVTEIAMALDVLFHDREPKPYEKIPPEKMDPEDGHLKSGPLRLRTAGVVPFSIATDAGKKLLAAEGRPVAEVSGTGWQKALEALRSPTERLASDDRTTEDRIPRRG